jgi:hypothetical protein
MPAKQTSDETSTEVVPTRVTEKRQILQQGQKYDVEIEYNESGQTVLVDSVYKEVPLPGSNKTTKVLVAAKGSVVQGY